MKTIPYDPTWMEGVSYRYDGLCYTPKEHLAAIIHLCRLCNGNIVEIGGNVGITSRNLAINLRSRLIYSVDYIGSAPTMNAEQQAENPGTAVFRDCMAEPNVVCLLSRGDKINYGALVDARIVFIDGDHSYEGVKADTLNAFSQLDSTEQPALLVWHDCSEHETWSGVFKWLVDFENGSHIEVRRIEDTSLAYAFI